MASTHGPRSLGSLKLVALLSSSGGRELWRAIDEHGNELLTVRARGIGGWKAMRRERALIATLHDEGISAAPHILRRTFGSYSIESVHELSLSSGRRMNCTQPAAQSDPGTEKVRLDLLDLLSELHTRSLTLNLAGARGVGFRADGSVVVIDFSRVGEASFTRVRADTRWVESLVSGVSRLPATLKRQPGGELTVAEPLPKHMHSEMGVRGAPAKRRKTWATVVAVAVGVVVLIAGIDHVMQPSAPANAGSVAASDEGGSSTGESKKQLQEKALKDSSLATPTAVVEGLAAERHAYLTGQNPHNAAALEGSPAAKADTDIRKAFTGVSTTGGQTRVHSVKIKSQESTAATLQVRVSETETHVQRNGTARSTPATKPHDVAMELKFVEGRWKINNVTAL